LLGVCPTPLELGPLEEDPEEGFFEPWLVVEVDLAGAGVVALGTDVCPAPVPELAPEVSTLITCAGPAAALEGELERPISTPTPIESSSTPTPAITAVVLPARGGSAAGAPVGDGPAESGAAVVCAGERRAPRSPASALPTWGLRVPHSRQ
jgi:hypothetical protein